jgi:hypothetical protein
VATWNRDKQETAIGPWQHGAWLGVGGLVAIGFPSDYHLFTLSWNGRGIFDLRTFERVARDYQDPAGADWFARDQLSASGIGEFNGRVIPVVGLWGGEGHTTTLDGWRLESRVERGNVLSTSLIDPAGSNVTSVPLSSMTEYRAVSFNPSGRFLLLAASSEVQVLTRPAAPYTPAPAQS